jgi:DNA-binding MurR/RpiR family transcriptional regulator
LEHLNEASEGIIYDLAELKNSSRTTIWGMIQKLGYTSYTEFRHELKKAAKNYIYYDRILPLEN